MHHDHVSGPKKIFALLHYYWHTKETCFIADKPFPNKTRSPTLIVITHIMTASKSLAGKALSVSHRFLNLCRATAICICRMEFHFLSSTAPEMLGDSLGPFISCSQSEWNTGPGLPPSHQLPQQWLCWVFPHRNSHCWHSGPTKARRVLVKQLSQLLVSAHKAI